VIDEKVPATPAKSPEVLELERQLAEEEAAIAALDKASEAQELQDRLAAKKQERLEKELIQRFEPEFGRFGRGFTMVQSSTGPVFFARKQAVLMKQWENCKKPTDADVMRFIRPCIIYPELDKFDEIVDRERGLAISIVERLVYLYGFRKADIEGKA